jgi:hypothetical protein
VRKINLVDNESLRETYFDVMVCSIRGKTSLLSLLSGGKSQRILGFDSIRFLRASPTKNIFINVFCV